MSTETIDPPVEIPAVTTLPNPVLTLDMDAILAAANPKPPEKGNATQAKEKPAGEAAAVVEKAKETPEPAKETPKTEPTKNDKETNLANMRKQLEELGAARKQADEELAKVRSEYETFRKAPELPEEVKTKLTRAEQAEKELQETRQSLRIADLSRDPEFRERYTKGIQAKVTVMGQIATEAGIPAADWNAAVTNWNEAQFGEWRESMTPVQRVKFDAAWTGAVQLYQDQQEKLQDAEKTYETLTKQRQEQADAQRKQALSQNEQLARKILADVLAPEGTKAFADLPAAAEAAVLAAARYEMSAEDVLRNVAANQVLARSVQKQAKDIETLNNTVAEKDAKIAELEAFVKEHSGSVARTDGVGRTAGVEDDRPIWERVVVRT